MNILITNDDGIDAIGIRKLAAWASKLGDVTVVAPMYEQSGKSQGINVHTEIRVEKRELADGITGYAVDSTPADCVRYALNGLKKRYDVVLSGVNWGLNVGPEFFHSGTLGAAYEAAYAGIPVLALSLFRHDFETAADHLDEIYEYVCQNDLFSVCPLYSVNIPVQPKGIRIATMSMFEFVDCFFQRENGMVSMPKGQRKHEVKTDSDCDVDVVLNGYISITPITLERTDMAAYEKLRVLNR
ncbi:MAG: 5'/3'-nucleotidase SurE [Lachnospiraceae bacterium]|nr:5'/3'-nucleotidase SurE [Lachnospiraceae bacterium]